MIFVGTSGYNYPEWKGKFYPADLPAAKMLQYYADRFSDRRNQLHLLSCPDRENSCRLVLADARTISDSPSKHLAASRTIRSCAIAATSSERFARPLRRSGPSWACCSFSCRRRSRKTWPVLEEFLAELPPRVRGAFEFRHASWLDEEVFERLKERNLALCVADTDRLSTPVVRTADYGYFRLRDEGYTASDIDRWARVIGERTDGDTFVYFKHEEAGKGPEFARALMKELGLSLSNEQ